MVYSSISKMARAQRNFVSKFKTEQNKTNKKPNLNQTNKKTQNKQNPTIPLIYGGFLHAGGGLYLSDTNRALHGLLTRPREGHWPDNGP